MKNLDPRVKLLAIFILTSFAVFFRKPLCMFYLLLATVLVSCILGSDFKLLFVKLKRLIYLVCGLSFMQIFFVRTGDVLLSIGEFILIFSDGLERTLVAVFRIFILLCSASIIAKENSRRIIASLSKIGVPYTISFMVMLSLRFIPFFMESFSDAMIAIQLRGIELKKVALKKKVQLFSHLLSPVVADVIVKSEKLAIAMEARGFGACKKRTSFIELHLCICDWCIIVLLVCLTIITLVCI